MPRCIHRTVTSDVQCPMDSIEGQERCRKHHADHVALHQRIGQRRDGGCSHITTGRNARWCDRFAETNGTLCLNHRRIADRREAERQELAAQDLRITELYNELVIADPLPAWQDVVRTLHGQWRNRQYTRRVMHGVIQKYAQFSGVGYGEYRALIMQLDNPIAAQAQPLAAIAADRQNVHTRAVTYQTNEGMKKILAAEVSPEPFTLTKVLRWFVAIYKFRKMSVFLSMMQDMATWYDQETCRADGDWLYRKVLDGVCVLIEKSEHKDALIMRLYEEAKEAHGLCCDGHITRLINVFVGFDTIFETPISKNELIQNRMSAIAARADSVDAKILAANAEFDQLGVPTDERLVWLEAFEAEDPTNNEGFALIH